MTNQNVIITVVSPFTDHGSIDFAALDRIIDSYIEAGAGGLFVGCQTGEALDLSVQENLAICEHTATRTNGETPVYAGLNRGQDISTQIAQLKDLKNAGADEPVIWLSTLPSPEKLGEQVLQIIDSLGGLVGVYECPLPEHRLLTDDDLTMLAASERIGFFKDTCRDNDTFRRRLSITKDSTIRSYQANLQCLPQSLKDGAAGYSGILSGSVAKLCVDYVRSGDPSLYQKMESIQAAIVNANHPASSKHTLNLLGLPVSSMIRNGSELDTKALPSLDKLISQLQSA